MQIQQPLHPFLMDARAVIEVVIVLSGCRITHCVILPIPSVDCVILLLVVLLAVRKLTKQQPAVFLHEKLLSTLEN